MNSILRHLCAVFIASSMLFSTTTAFAKQGHELLQDVVSPDTKVEIEEGQDKVYNAVKNGELRPFSELYAVVESQLKGRVIKVELEKNRSGWEYELKLVEGEQVFEAKYDGGTLELLELEGRDLINLIKRPVTP
ncbi:PepSY domain-containing protein [Vibrio ulleungensis]|uniref:PepSY domain-containing protein n=1 Tax=Vibrio ulleungensis TaxID=2807619 RepID=A0ABS2HHM3_9VIBR|nr:hypothetical protein [Vibrio ulleungensis]MBM7037030.1 hypothetical protein [Vibrio ulleungensis]